MKIHKNPRKNTHFGWSGVQVRPQIGPQMAPKTAQEAPKMAQEAPKTAQEAFKTAQEAPRTPQEAPKTAQEAPNTLQERLPDIDPASRMAPGWLRDRSGMAHGWGWLEPLGRRGLPGEG